MKYLESESELRKALIALLSRREYSRAEIEHKYSSRCDAKLLAAVLDDFHEAGYQSDQRCAGMIVRSKAQQGYGKMRVLQDARRRGVSDDLIEDALREEAIDWFENARRVYRSKFGMPLKDYDRKSYEKRMRFMLSRGFSFEEIKFATEFTDEEC